MPDINEPFDTEPSTGISRRTVTKAMAWAVPVIAVSASVPAYAASQGILELTGAACKLPGASADIFKGYAFGISATNSFNVPITVTIDTLILNGTDLGNLLIINLDTCTILGVNTFTLAAGQTLSNLVVLTQNAANSEQGELEASYTFTGGPGGSETVSAAAPVTPPVQGAVCDDFSEAEKDCVRGLVGTP